MNSYPVKKGEVLPLDIESLAFGGRGVARIDGYTIFVDDALPGQRVEARVLRRRKTHGEARIETVITSSPDQCPPRCSHFGRCGGCRLQHLEYEAQIRAKRDQVEQLMHRLGGLKSLTVEPTLPSPEIYEYRNKMEYSFSNTRWLEAEELEKEETIDRFGAGLHLRGRYDRIVDIDRCHLQKEPGSRILSEVRRRAAASRLPAYSTRTHEGFWRFLVIREGQVTGDRMALLITNRALPGGYEWRAVEELGRVLAAGDFGITSLLHGETSRKASIAVPETVRVLNGEPVIREILCGLTFEIGPTTFFQTNSAQAERLFSEALKRGGFGPEDVVYDLYCGVGALSLPLAKQVRRVHGIEIVAESIEAARRNAVLNDIDNVIFEVGDIRDRLRAEGERPDGVILDPPRAGVHGDVLARLIALASPRIVYVSCNPSTLARDLGILTEGGYRVDSVLPVDMFPHTAHVECVATLSR